MSMKAWTEEGFGVPLYNETNFGAIKDFIVSHNFPEANNRDAKVRASIIDAEDDFELEDVLGEPVAWVVAGIIRDETGYDSFSGYNACGDTDQEAYIGFKPVWPWDLTDSEHKLTKDVAMAVLERYSEELEIDEPPDYFEAEYFG